MNLLDLTKPGGFPLRQDRIKFLQDSIVKAFKSVGSGPRVFLSFDAGTGAPVYGQAYVLWGCEITDNGDDTLTIAEGAIFQEGEVFEVIEHTIATSAAAYKIYHFAQELIDDPDGVKEYADGETYATQKVRRAKLQFTTFPTNGDWLSALFFYPQTKVVVSIVDWTAPTFLSTLSIPVREISLTNNWNNSHNGKIKVQAHHDGRVDVIAHLTPNAGVFPTNNVITTLPVGYRPQAELIHYLGYFEGASVFLKIATNGQCSFVDEVGASTDNVASKMFSLNISYFK